MKIKSPYLVKPHTRVDLKKTPTSDMGGFKSEQAAAAVLVEQRRKFAELQEIFYASQKKALLIVLQGMDTAGKDGTIRHIFSGVSPQGCDVTAFKVPTPLEAHHDFLWRAHKAVPPRGMIGIFNRSHYEDVLSPRVHGLITAKVARRRLDDINNFEDMLADNDVVILKFFLHISHKEQTSRLQSRIDRSKKNWKLTEADIHERKFWPQYEHAYWDILSTTSRKDAPWFIIPSDNKWFRNIAISKVLVDVMDGLKLSYPEPALNLAKLKL